MINGNKTTRMTLGRMTKGLLVAGVVVTGVLASRGAFAGARATGWEVSISGSSSGTFKGSVSAARYSADSVQWIGCELEWYGPNSSNTATVVPSNIGYCSGRNSAGTTRTCYITTRYGNAMSLVGAVNMGSMLSVQYFTVDGNVYCGDIKIYNYSDNQ